MTLKKRIFGILLTMVMIVSCIPALNMSYAADVIDSGVYDGVPWSITSDYELIIGESGNSYTFVNKEKRVETDYPWDAYRSELRAIRIEGRVYGNGSLDYMFFECRNVTSIDVSELDTSKVTSMENMFCGCRIVTDLDLSGFDTRNVTSFGGMFAGCFQLENLNISGFDTSKATDLSGMFTQCRNLPSLDLSRFNTSNVTDMGGMFQVCESLTDLDLSGFDTRKVTDMQYMFIRCSRLTELNLSSFDASLVEDMYGLLEECTSLTVLKIGKGFNTNTDWAEASFPVAMYESESGVVYDADDVIPSTAGKTYLLYNGDPYVARKYKYYSTVTKYLNQRGFDTVPSMRNTLQNQMNTDLSGPIPGIIKTNISDGTACYSSIRYVPQGLCKFGSYYLVTAYEKPEEPKKHEDRKKSKHSVIYVLDRSWNLKTTVTIGDYNYHNGGLAYDPDGDVLWFCGNTEPDYTGTPFVRGLTAEKLREVISSGDKMAHIDSFTTDEVYLNNKPSCLDYHNGRLWVGTCGSSKGSIVGYKTDGINLDTKNTVHITNVEKNLNGFTFEDDSTLYASYSSGRSREKYSKINRYVVSGSYSKGSILRAENACSIDVPRMNEEIMISDGYLYILYESGAEEYNNAFIRTDRITPLPTSLWSTGTYNSPAKMMALGNSSVSSINTGEPQMISFRYRSLEDVNETTCDLTFTPEESGLYTISVSDLNGSDNVFVTTEVTDGENYLGNADTAEYRYQEEDESGIPYDFYDGSSCKVFLTGGKNYNISMTADIMEPDDPAAYEEESNVEYSGSYKLTVSGETDLSALVPEASEGEEKTLAAREGEAGCFCFTPEKTGTYRIDLGSDGTLGDILILKDMKDAVSFNGELCDLEAGKKYYFITSLSERGDAGAEAEINFSAYRLESEAVRTDEPVKMTGDTSMNYTATDDGVQIIKVEGGTVEQIIVFDQNGDTVAAGDGDVLFETQKNKNYRIMCTGCNGEISVSISAYSEDDPDTPTPMPDDSTPVDPIPVDPQPAPIVTPTVPITPAAPAEIVDLPAVKISKPKASKKKITVKWKKVSKKNLKKISGIQIQVATDPGFTDIVKTATAGKKKISKKIKGLTAKQTYYVRIRAYKNTADGKHVSAWKAKKIKVK